jgi:hypothetical protein
MGNPSPLPSLWMQRLANTGGGPGEGGVTSMVDSTIMAHAAAALDRRGHELGAELWQVLRTHQGWEGFTYPIWDPRNRMPEPELQAQWERIRLAWDTFAIEVMAILTGLPAHPQTVAELVRRTREQVEAAADQVRQRLLDQAAAELERALEESR